MNSCFLFYLIRSCVLEAPCSLTEMSCNFPISTQHVCLVFYYAGVQQQFISMTDESTVTRPQQLASPKSDARVNRQHTHGNNKVVRTVIFTEIVVRAMGLPKREE